MRGRHVRLGEGGAGGSDGERDEGGRKNGVGAGAVIGAGAGGPAGVGTVTGGLSASLTAVGGVRFLAALATLGLSIAAVS